MLLYCTFAGRRFNYLKILSRKSKHINLSYRLGFVLLLIFSHFGISAQNLCNQPEGSVKGDFNLEEFTFCAPKTVIVKDKSGGENIRYNFVYQGQGPEALNPNVPFVDRYRYTGFVNPTIFTIIQYGTKDGKPMYACKNHVVRQSNKAYYSFSACNRTSFSLAIPADSLLNDYDYYEISNNKFNTIIQTVKAEDLPFEKTFDLPLPQRIYVRGVYNDQSKNCSGDIGSDYIANPDQVPTTGLSIPFNANIDALLLNDKGMELDVKGGLASTYSLFRRDLGGTYSDTPVAKGLKPGRRTVTFDESTKQSCFMLKKEQTGCRVEESAEICTTPITQIKQLSGKQRVFFEQYPLPYKEVADNKDNFVKVTQQKLEIIENQILYPGGKTILPKQDSIDHEIFGCDRVICYYTTTFVEGNNRGINFRSEVRSNLKCYKPSDRKIEQNFSLVASINAEEKAVLNIDEIQSSVYPLTQYFIYQKSGNNYSIADTLKAPSSKYTTKLDASEKSYCFKVQAQDECGSSSPISDPICTIYLNFKDNKTLEWTKESPFTSPVDKYEILTKGASGNLDKSFYELEGDIFKYDPNLALFQDEATFRVQAKSSAGSSFSNVVLKELDPKIFIPTAFTPNSDGINDALFLIGNTKRIKTVEFKILNRRGLVVYASKDPNFQWTPKVNEASNGNYYFDLRIILDNDDVIIKNGSFSILK
ncbi:gliding motility-associated C-terminal domain-containing protein [Spirosomataceae bacterium TFI 002]|nr:gliding motility-associated C-terminal domain-containing protein [Spirosomataceae bacterium TFI 002]